MNPRKWLRRPFPNAHWTLLAALLLAWLYAFLDQTCKEGGYYFEAMLLSATVCVALWCSHLRVLTEAGWRRLGNLVVGAAYDCCLLLVMLVVAAIPFAIMLPSVSCYTNRSKVSDVILAGSAYRSEISERITKSGSLKDSGFGVHVIPSGRVAAGYVSREGQIMLVSDEPVAVVVLAPKLEAGKVIWRCSGLPMKYMPGSCKESFPALAQ